MTKSIAIVALFAGIALFASSIFSIESMSSTKKHSVVSYNEVAVVHQSPATNVVETVSIPTKVAHKAGIKPTKSTKSASRVTVAYNHILEQGGSPTARTVRVIEGL